MEKKNLVEYRELKSMVTGRMNEIRLDQRGQEDVDEVCYVVCKRVELEQGEEKQKTWRQWWMTKRQTPVGQISFWQFVFMLGYIWDAYASFLWTQYLDCRGERPLFRMALQKLASLHLVLDQLEILSSDAALCS